MPEQFVCEHYNNNTKSVYRVQKGSNRLTSPLEKNGGGRRLPVGTFFRDVFLPQGYPDSVTDDYFEYQCWDTMQAFCSSLTGTLAMEAVMKSVGVGDASATVVAATLAWLLKDGAGMVGRIVFAWVKGSYLDGDSKKWRLVADMLNDLAIFVDILSPYFKPLFIYMICFSSICRSIVCVAGGATRAALTQHQARRNNLADVSAKDGSQETLVNLSGLMVSMVLVPLVSGKPTLVWTFFCIFTLLHIFANYRAVRSLRMDTVNESRYRILIRNYFNNGPMSVPEVNHSEPILFNGPGGRCRLEVGCRLSDIGVLRQGIGGDEWYEIGITAGDCDTVQCRNFGRKLRWWFGVCGYLRIGGRRSYVVRVALREGIDAENILKAAFHAEKIRTEMSSSERWTNEFDEVLLLESTKAAVDRTFEPFLEQLRSNGWITSYTLLHRDEWRYCFMDDVQDQKEV